MAQYSRSSTRHRSVWRPAAERCTCLRAEGAGSAHIPHPQSSRAGPGPFRAWDPSTHALGPKTSAPYTCLHQRRTRLWEQGMAPPGASREEQVHFTWGTGAGPSDACCVGATHGILLGLFFHSPSPRGSAPATASQSIPWERGDALTPSLQLACLSLPQILSLSLIIYLPGGFVWVFIQT